MLKFWILIRQWLYCNLGIIRFNFFFIYSSLGVAKNKLKFKFRNVIKNMIAGVNKNSTKNYETSKE